MNRPSLFTLLAFVMGLGFVVAGAKGAAAHDDASLLRNVASLQTTNIPSEKQVPISQLKAELATLWDKPDAPQPLAAEVVHVESKNGCKVEGVYINGPPREDGRQAAGLHRADRRQRAGKESVDGWRQPMRGP
jgi:hypothetical protein